MSARTRVYTDGACSGNPGPGGWAWAVPDGPWAAGPSAQTTNQRMEVEAAFEALKSNPGPLTIVSDSTYVVKCFQDNWWRGWIKRGWKNSAKKPVANRDLWEPFIELYQERDVTFEWVKGHSGDTWNDVADQLAVEARDRQKNLQGIGDALGRPGQSDVVTLRTEEEAAETAAPAKAAADSPIPGHLIVIAGHRPPEIGGYGPNPIADSIRDHLARILEAKLSMHPDAVVITGMGLGVEQLGAEAAAAANVPYVGVLAFPDPSAVWPKPAQKHFDELLDAAQDVIVLQKSVPDTKPAMGTALKQRDAWLARHGAEAILVGDPKDRGISSFARVLEKSLGEDVWTINPADL